MTHVTCRLTAKNLDQLCNPTLGNRVWATFSFYLLLIHTSEERQWRWYEHSSHVKYNGLGVLCIVVPVSHRGTNCWAWSTLQHCRPQHCDWRKLTSGNGKVTSYRQHWRHTSTHYKLQHFNTELQHQQTAHQLYTTAQWTLDSFNR